MSTTSPTTLSPSASKPFETQMTSSPARWLREPLLHFVLLGGLLFAVDAVLHRGGDDAHVIVVGPEVDSEAREIFEESRGRAPDSDERKALLGVWLDNEVLYREGLALQVDRGDPAIRERVIFKALSVIDANVKLPQADQQTLRAWFESHRVKYDEPARYDFEEAVLVGANTEAAVRDFVRTLNTGTPREVEAGLRVFKGRPLANLVQSYGEDFAAALGTAPSPEWRALPTRDGWRAIRLNAATSARPAEFEPIKTAVLQDWKDAVAAEQRSAAVRVLAKKYSVRFQAAE